jgi:hypothetical protein
MGDLTKNFSLDEFLVSDTADRLGITNTAAPDIRQRIAEVTAPFMQKVRDKVGRSITIHSGYRNPAVNKAVGGVKNSAHTDGYGADITAAGHSAFVLAKIIAGDPCLMADVDQLILESGRGVVHVSVDVRRRGQVLTQKGGPGSPVVAGIV